jgi:hypothetical protein
MSYLKRKLAVPGLEEEQKELGRLPKEKQLQSSHLSAKMTHTEEQDTERLFRTRLEELLERDCQQLGPYLDCE